MLQRNFSSNDSFRRIYTQTNAVIFLSLALISFVGLAKTDVPSGFSETLIAND